jgi:hypothetical protein
MCVLHSEGPPLLDQMGFVYGNAYDSPAEGIFIVRIDQVLPKTVVLLAKFWDHKQQTEFTRLDACNDMWNALHCLLG